MEENNLENEAQTVGEIIRNARLKQGRTISDASEELCIRKAYVEAIETMDLSKMPQMPYALGFVRSYADYLGLNSNRIVFLYRKAIMGDTAEEDENIQNEEPSVPNLKHLLFAFIGLIIVFAIWTSWPILENMSEEKFGTREDTVVSEPEIVDAEQTAAEGSAPEEVLSEEKEAQAADEQKEDSEDVKTEEETQENTETDKADVKDEKKIKFVLTGPTWIELKQGDKVLLNGVYRKGFEYELTMGQGQIITIGRHYNVRFYVNGKQTKVLSAIRSRDVKIDEVIK